MDCDEDMTDGRITPPYSENGPAMYAIPAGTKQATVETLVHMVFSEEERPNRESLEIEMKPKLVPWIVTLKEPVDIPFTLCTQEIMVRSND